MKTFRSTVDNMNICKFCKNYIWNAPKLPGLMTRCKSRKTNLIDLYPVKGFKVKECTGYEAISPDIRGIEEINEPDPTKEPAKASGVTLCEYCPLTSNGETVNTGPHNLCEGSKCDEALEAYQNVECLKCGHLCNEKELINKTGKYSKDEVLHCPKCDSKEDLDFK